MINKKDVVTYIGCLLESKAMNTKHRITKIVINDVEALFTRKNIFHITDESGHETEEFSGDKVLKLFVIKRFEVKSTLTESEKNMISVFLDNLFYENVIDIALKNRDEELFEKVIKMKGVE